MADATTVNYGWTMPEDGASSGTWGPKLNDALGKTTAVLGIDAVMKSVSDVASAALPKAGGTTTGEIYMNGYGARANVVAKGAVSGAQSLDCNAGRNFTITPTTVTLSITNAPAGAFGLVVKISAGSGGLTWPASVKWPSGTAPTLTAGTDYIGLVSLDGGTSYCGVQLGLGVS